MEELFEQLLKKWAELYKFTDKIVTKDPKKFIAEIFN